MLAIGRALMSNPKLLLIDEPSLGLAPRLLDDVFDKITQLRDEQAIGIVIVEQKVREVLDICNRVYSMKLGKIAFEGQPEELKGDKVRLKDLFL